MRKLVEGRSRVVFTIDRLELTVGNGHGVATFQPFAANAVVEFAPYIRAGDSDEESVPEYMEFVSLHTVGHLYLTNSDGLTVSIDDRCNLLDILSENQYERFILMLKKQAAQGML